MTTFIRKFEFTELLRLIKSDEWGLLYWHLIDSVRIVNSSTFLMNSIPISYQFQPDIFPFHGWKPNKRWMSFQDVLFIHSLRVSNAIKDDLGAFRFHILARKLGKNYCYLWKYRVCKWTTVDTYCIDIF